MELRRSTLFVPVGVSRFYAKAAGPTHPRNLDGSRNEFITNRGGLSAAMVATVRCRLSQIELEVTGVPGLTIGRHISIRRHKRIPDVYAFRYGNIRISMRLILV